MIDLRPYQIEAIEAIETAAKDGTNRQLVALPDGYLR
jgi:type I site-specific restriction endonuclease